jgi:signal transduction histidine kinase
VEGYRVQNATAQKLAKIARASALDERALAKSLDCLRTAITIFDSDEKLVYANRHYNYLLRALPPRAELIGISYRDLIRLEAEGGELDTAYCTNLDSHIASRRAQFVQGVYKPLDIHLADGRIVEIKARPTHTGGWILLWTDVTRERQMFARLETALAMSADAFAFFDSDDRLALSNAQYAALGGHSESMEGKSFAEILDVTVRNKSYVMDETWAARRLEAHRSPAGAMTLESCDGTAWLLRDRPTPDGGRIAVMTDITDTRRIEMAFVEQKETLARTKDEMRKQASYLADLTRKLDEAAAEANNTKTTLLRTMSHELKTPLNAIIGFSDLLSSMSDRFTPEQAKEYADLIHSGGNNLLRLINHILDLTKIAAGRYELNRRMVDAGALAWNVKGNYAAMASIRQVDIDADGAPAGMLVYADEVAFETMVTQLVDNAVRFTQAGGQVRLSVLKSADKIKLVVSDNGPGVEAKDLERILRPFEQAGRAITEHTGGAGLGLTLTKAFAELHGGALQVESMPGNGLVATLELPALDT